MTGEKDFFFQLNVWIIKKYNKQVKKANRFNAKTQNQTNIIATLNVMGEKLNQHTFKQTLQSYHLILLNIKLL